MATYISFNDVQTDTRNKTTTLPGPIKDTAHGRVRNCISQTLLRATPQNKKTTNY